METTTNRKRFINPWYHNCYNCNQEYCTRERDNSRSYDNIPSGFCCEKCYMEYNNIENKRDRKINSLLNEREV